MENKKISVKNLKKNFGSLEVLRHISLDVAEGEVVCLIGPSGSGKSTFLRCLNRLETITAGEVVVDGHPISDSNVNINKVRENIGMVFQHFNLFPHLTVQDNITLAPVELKKMDKENAAKKGHRAFGAGRACRQSQNLSRTTVWRTEAASGHCPCAGHESGYYAV